MDEPDRPSRVSRNEIDWLDAESGRWVDAGFIDAPARARILGAYVAEPPQARGMLALVVVALLICSVGVLLLIGYNWHRIPPAVKVAGLLGSVAAAFGAAAGAYARGRSRLGELLGFAGTLLFGNAIWLVAQVLHIQGHFPDAFLWFAIGALAAAALLHSKVNGVAAALLLIAWIVAEGSFGPRPRYSFLLLWPAAVWVAYQVKSPVMVRALGIAAACWITLAIVDETDSVMVPGALVLTGCALYAAQWHSRGSRLAAAWRQGGLIVLLAVFIPLMISQVQADIAGHQTAHLDGLTIAITVALAIAALSPLARGSILPADLAVLAVAAVDVLWIAGVLLAGPRRKELLSAAGTLAFVLLALAMAVSLVRTAFRSGRTSDLVFGVLFALAFLIVRWASVDSLLWSGLLLLASGGGLLAIAQLWRHRDRTLVIQGGAS